MDSHLHRLRRVEASLVDPRLKRDFLHPCFYIVPVLGAVWPLTAAHSHNVGSAELSVFAAKKTPHGPPASNLTLRNHSATLRRGEKYPGLLRLRESSTARPQGTVSYAISVRKKVGALWQSSSSRFPCFALIRVPSLIAAVLRQSRHLGANSQGVGARWVFGQTISTSQPLRAASPRVPASQTL